MAKDQKVTLNFKMSDGTTKAVSFTVPAGAGGILPPVAEVIDDNTDVQAVAERFFNAMEQKFTEPKVVQYFNVTDAADPTAPPVGRPARGPSPESPTPPRPGPCPQAAHAT